jgi:hypothetical protein
MPTAICVKIVHVVQHVWIYDERQPGHATYTSFFRIQDGNNIFLKIFFGGRSTFILLTGQVAPVYTLHEQNIEYASKRYVEDMSYNNSSFCSHFSMTNTIQTYRRQK